MALVRLERRQREGASGTVASVTPVCVQSIPSLHAVQRIWPPGAPLSYVPASQPHSSELLAPLPPVVEPMGQETPTAVRPGQYCPTLQRSHESTLAEKEPAAQMLQLDCAAWSWNVPTSAHGTHKAMLAFGATIPGLHGVCAALPVGA